MNGFLSGLFLGFSLIIAIGSQNAFVLKQGLKREYVFIVCAICALSDVILMAMGIFGLSKIVTSASWIVPMAKYGGAIFLFLYGAKSFWASIVINESLVPEGTKSSSLTEIIIMCLAFTWLNPHVYLDTVLLLGSISIQYPNETVEFFLGSAFASLIFFFTLGYGARLLAAIFKDTRAWKILDFCIGCVMWFIAIDLIRN
jgi:L-lysine exporter family protein LysE/ArgO